MRRLVVLLALLVFAVPASATPTRILAPMDWWPVWSPDATHVAFTRVFPNHMELWVLDLRTHRTTHVGTSAGQLGPTWSKDGTHLAYASGGTLYTAAANGAARRRYLAPSRSYAPAWRPDVDELAYLTTKGATNTDLWVAGTLWARNAIGSPSWSPGGSQLAFQRDDGIYLADAPQSERRLVTVANPGAPVWSHGGNRIAYVAAGHLFTVLVATSEVTKVATPPHVTGTPAFSYDDKRLAVPAQDRIWVSTGVGGQSYVLSGPGVSWSPRSYWFVASGGRGACPGHTVLRESGVGGSPRTLTGSCLVSGSAGPDVIEGTPLGGDQIVGGAGNDRIHANDRHIDRVNCGPGRDEVWADRTDRLTACEVVHR